MSSELTWPATLDRLGRWADEVDRQRAANATAVNGAARAGSGMPASLWALTKTSLSLLAGPITTPAVIIAALRAAHVARDRIDRLPEHLHALAEGRTPPLPGDRTLRLAGSDRYLITSDLHRCIPGRLDWPGCQRVKDLYAEVLARYADDGWHLVENGDVEDYWMVGGSTWGMVYDLASLAELASGALRFDPGRAAYCAHLDRIVENNERTYEVLRDGFCADGRYHRTMGNHDDVYDDDALGDHLSTHLPGTEMADTILLTTHGATPGDGISGVDAVVAHGHLTDSWNGPGLSALGRAITWAATGLDDLPRGAVATRFDGLPTDGELERLRADRGYNRLITIDPRFGGNRRFDSLDEQRVFARLAEAAPEGGWPWLVHGHTHYPMLRPLDPAGEPTRYANSGCGVLNGAFTALEWDGSRPDEPLTLVLWSDDGDGAERVELVPDGARLRVA